MRGASAAAMKSALPPPVRNEARAVFDWGASSPLFLTFPAISVSLLGDRRRARRQASGFKRWRELFRGWRPSEAVLPICPFLGRLAAVLEGHRGAAPPGGKCSGTRCGAGTTLAGRAGAAGG